MKRIYLYGRMVRIPLLLSSALLLYAFADMYIQSNFSFMNLALLALVVGFVVWEIIWLYSMGIFVDPKQNKLTIVTGFAHGSKKEIVLSNLESLDVELNGNLGMTFLIHYKYNRQERFEYKFFRIYIVEKSQYKRIKKQLSKIV